MNSQIVSIKKAVESEWTFVFVTSLIPFCLFLKAGFVSISVIWFFTLCLFNSNSQLKRQLRIHYVLFLPILFFALNIVWLILSSDIRSAASIVLREIHLFLIPLGFIVVNKKITKNDFHIFLWVFLITCLLCSLVCFSSALFNSIKFKSLFFYEAGNRYPYFTHYLLTQAVNITPVYLSLFSNFCLVIMVTLPLVKNLKARVAVVVYLVFFIIMLGSKVGIFCMIIIIVFRFMIIAKSRYIYPVVGFLALGVMFFLYSNLVTKDFLHQFLEFKYKESEEITFESANRLAIWSMALETIEQSPVIGFGTGEGQQALEATYEKHNFSFGVRDSLNPHNQFLSTILDFGLIGFGVLALMLIIPLVQAIKAKDTFVFCFIMIVVLFFCVESVLVRQKGIVFFSFFYSLLICEFNHKPPTNSFQGE